MIEKRTKLSPGNDVNLTKFKLFQSPFSMEINRLKDGKYAVVIGEVCKILRYDQTEMTFRCHSCIVSVEGEKLLCKSYQNGYVEVTGKVLSIQLR